MNGGSNTHTHPDTQTDTHTHTHTHTLCFYLCPPCVGCQGGLDRGSGHRQRSGVRLPPAGHRCSPAVAGEWLSPVTGCQRAGFATHRCSSAVTSQVNGCYESLVVKGQGSPLTSVHQLSQVSVTSHRVSKGKVHHSPVFISCHR